MKGLLLKDLLNLKKTMKFYLLMIVFYGFLALVGDGDTSASLGGMLAILLSMLPITAMSYDERSKWDRYGLSLPVSRRDMVLSKYVLGFLTSFAGLAITFVFGLTQGTVLAELVLTSALFFGIGLLLQSVLLPVLFQVGSENSRVIMIAVLIIPSLIIYFLFANPLKFNLAMPGAAFFRALPYVAAVAVILLYLLSIRISLRIYGKKDF